MNKDKIANEYHSTGKFEAYSENDMHQAIKELRPGCNFDLTISNGNYIYNSFSDPNGLPAPTKEEVESQLKYQNECREYYSYAYERCKEYPDGFEQLDMLWHAINNQQNLKESDWFLTIKAVKEKYPKPDREPPIFSIIENK